MPGEMEQTGLPEDRPIADEAHAPAPAPAHGPSPATSPAPAENRAQGEQMAARDTAAREAMDALNERNRIMVEARMLPPQALLSDEQVAAIVEHFKAYCAEHDIKAAQVAREIDYTPGVISS